MEEIQEIISEYEMVVVNLSEENKLKQNLEKYRNCKKLLSKPVLEKIIKVPNFESTFIKMLNSLLGFDDLEVAEIFEYI